MGRDDLVASAAYQPEPAAAAAARRFVRETLQAWLVTRAADGHGLVDDAVLLTSELVTNAVVHAGTPVQVTCRLAGGEVEVVVSDCHPARLVPEPAESEHGAAERTSGRGLLLPAALASAWGVTYGRAAKAVWFRLGVAGAPGAPSAAGWGNGLGEGLGANLVGEFEAELAGGTALAAAFGSAAARTGGFPPDAPRERDGSITNGHRAGHGYQQLAEATAESARAAVGAEGACVLLADEDGDLRLRAAAGSMWPPSAVEVDAGGVTGRAGAAGAPSPLAVPPSALTVPFVVDGRVTGLLAAVSARPGSFGDAEAVALQRLADACGPRLQRAWVDELDRVRRDRIAALGDARALLSWGLRREEIMAHVGRAVVPRLAPWCALLLPGSGERPRLAYLRHCDDAGTADLAQLIECSCEAAPPPAAQPGGGGPGWRWRLGDAGSPADTAWCFPVGQPWDGQSLLLLGTGPGGRLSREVGALAGDLACRIGLALAGAGGLTPARPS